MGDARLGARYGGVLGLPLTFLIDRSGIVRARFQGETDRRLIERRMAMLLAQPDRVSGSGASRNHAPQANATSKGR